MTSTFPEYWGDVHIAASGCESFHFNHEDTITQSFDSLHLRERTCQQLCGSPGCDRMASSPGPYPLPGIEMESPMIKLRRHAPAPDLT